jgi:hypothetical protein
VVSQSLNPVVGAQNHIAAAAAVAAVGAAFGLMTSAQKTDAAPPAIAGGCLNYRFIYKTHGPA